MDVGEVEVKLGMTSGLIQILGVVQNKRILIKGIKEMIGATINQRTKRIIIKEMAEIGVIVININSGITWF